MTFRLFSGARIVGFASVVLGCSASDDDIRREPGAGGAPGIDAGTGHDTNGGSGGSSAGSGAIGGDGGLGGSAGATGGDGGLGGSAGAAGSGGTSAGSAGSSGTGCLGELDALGVSYARVQAKGVVDAVELTGRINGVLFANGTSNTSTRDPMACEFVRTLYAFAALLKERGFEHVGTLGSYCYRCCCVWSTTNYCRAASDAEPDCGSSGFSNHSWGRAVDVRYLYKADGTRYDVNDTTQWLQWTATGDTCGPALAAQTGVSRELYQFVCEASARHLFSTVLTPNYNEAHRNHFHLDIGQSGPASGFFVKSYGLPTVDLAGHGDE